MSKFDITTLRALAERLEKATGPDREMDAALGNALMPRANKCPYHWKRAPALTSSIEAALALVRRLLPNEEWQIGSYCTSAGYCSIGQEDMEQQVGYFSATPALAILRALVAALISQAEAPNA